MNYPSLEKSASGIYRIVSRSKIRCLFVIFTLIPDWMEHYWLNHYFPEMMKQSFLWEPALQQIELDASMAVFKMILQNPYHVKSFFEGSILYAGKHPVIYSDPANSNGISNFTMLIDEHELTNRLEKLSHDIECGKIITIQNQYNDQQGGFCLSYLKNEVAAMKSATPVVNNCQFIPQLAQMISSLPE